MIQWDFVPDVELTAAPQNIDLEILLENEHVAFVNKPVGMVVHPSPGHPDGTLVNALAFHFQTLAGEGLRPGIVHRIDKDTSGVLVVAKTDEAHQILSRKFHDHDIQRTYHAIVWGPNLPDYGTFESTHHRSPNHRLRYTGKLEKGRKAVTHYKVKEFLDEHHKLVECWLETGRTHQIRMHFFEAGAPLIGDALYGFKNTIENGAINRQALHAKSLGFEMDGEHILVSCPYPKDFTDALDKLTP